MAKFRTNHRRQDRSGFSSLLIRATLFVIFCGIAFVYLYRNLGNILDSNVSATVIENGDDRFYLPQGGYGDVIHHKHYSLSYNEEHEQADWVAYLLTKESIRIPNVKRGDDFYKDPLVKTGSASDKDYARSGYTRGHLAPAGDMAFSEEAMRESFYLSNMSPQLRSFNNGIWRELEENVRNWAWDKEEIYVASGPLLKIISNKKIGNNGVSVPEIFFKVLLNYDDKHSEAIAFFIPNNVSNEHLHSYSMSIDEIEKHTGLDFFADLLDNDEEERIESSFDPSKWKVDEKRYKNRVEKWNNQ